ncbi:MAG TPA: hypothetical protein VMF13_05695, partial [Luteitalea sp.]|nr:hypothetical protein [Luteitalea sp.]
GLAAHADACPACREVRAVAEALQDVFALEAAEDLPAASDIWWRAKWTAEREARQKAMRPLDTLERAEPLVALVAVVTMLVMTGDRIVGRLGTWLAGDTGGQALHVLMPPALVPLLIVGAGLGGLVLLVGLGAVIAND